MLHIVLYTCIFMYLIIDQVIEVAIYVIKVCAGVQRETVQESI